MRSRGGGTSRRPGRKGVAVVTQELVEEERARMIQERQSEVQRVLDKHDDLVREAFHLEKFVSLLGYDPKEAKQDKSNVFLEYKSRYDLVDHTASAGPSRTTRRAHTERLQSLNAPLTSSPSAPSRSSKVKAPAKSTGLHEITSDVLRTHLVDAKGKGKEVVHQDVPRSISAATVTSHKRGRMRAAVVSPSVVASDPVASEALPGSHSRLRKRAEMLPPPDPPPHKRRRTESVAHVDTTEPRTDATHAKTTMKRTRGARTASDDITGTTVVLARKTHQIDSTSSGADIYASTAAAKPAPVWRVGTSVPGVICNARRPGIG
ncbi:hypothetical protein NM688_g8045 [Phlebia brevispora]|uniref:Uncharacterized protein n=1 Tax=Phlebia brevispora TaxID=194682 RepID=A0ACC1RY03_9APHY|nr:hypothetical protein NM688_g8045 [Phlebia brevispora]